MRLFIIVLAFAIGSESLDAQQAILSPENVGSISIIDGKMMITEKYTAVVPETRSRTESYTVLVPTSEGAKTEVRTRTVPYTVMVALFRTRVAMPDDFELSQANGREIDKKSLEEKLKSTGKPMTALLLRADQRLNDAEKMLLKDTTLILRRKEVSRPSLPTPRFLPAKTPILGPLVGAPVATVEPLDPFALPAATIGSPYLPSPEAPTGLPVTFGPSGSGEEDSSGSGSDSDSPEVLPSEVPAAGFPAAETPKLFDDLFR